MTDKAVQRSTVVVAPYAWVILSVVYFASLAAPLNQNKIPPILPVLMHAFQLNLLQAGSLMSVVAVGGLVLALPAGILLQRFGSRAIGLIALGCIAAGSAIGALAASYGSLLSSRMVEGIGIGLIGVVAPATIAMWFPPARQGMSMGIWATWFPVGSVVMAFLAPAVAIALGWRAVWWVGAGYALLILVIYGLLVHNPPDLPPAGFKDQASPGLRKALANRDIWLLALEFACFNLALASIATYYPTFLNEVRGYPLGLAAFLASISGMVILVSAPLAGWFSDRIGSRKLVIAIPFLVIAGLMILPFRVTGWQIIAIMLVQGLVAGAIPTATFAAAPEVMRTPEWAGLGLAVVLVGQNISALIGPVLFGGLVENLGWVMAGYMMIPVCLLGFISAWMVRIR